MEEFDRPQHPQFDEEEDDDIYQDMKDFDKRLKTKSDPFFGTNAQGDSSDEETVGGGHTAHRPLMTSEVDVLKEKNRILMEKLYKADKQLGDQKDLIETVTGKTMQSDNIKDKKILELAKKNRTLQLQVESLKTKAAKAAEIALKMKKENDENVASPKKSSQHLPTNVDMKDTLSTLGGASTMDAEKRLKEQEKKITKLRNDK